MTLKVAGSNLGKGSPYSITERTVPEPMPVLGNLRQVVHTHTHASMTKQYNLVAVKGWEGNRRSGVALAMRHRLQWFIHLRAHGPRKADEPTLLMAMAHLYSL